MDRRSRIFDFDSSVFSLYVVVPIAKTSPSNHLQMVGLIQTCTRKRSLL